MGAVWIDLLDPSEAELREKAPRELEESAMQLLLRPHVHQDEPRPTMQSHGASVFGVFLSAKFILPEVYGYIESEEVPSVQADPA